MQSVQPCVLLSDVITDAPLAAARPLCYFYSLFFLPLNQQRLEQMWVCPPLVWHERSFRHNICRSAEVIAACLQDWTDAGVRARAPADPAATCSETCWNEENSCSRLCLLRRCRCHKSWEQEHYDGMRSAYRLTAHMQMFKESLQFVLKCPVTFPAWIPRIVRLSSLLNWGL